MHGDLDFAHYNWAWLLLWVVLFGWLALMAVRLYRREPLLGARGRSFVAWLGRTPAAVVSLSFALLMLPWLVALANLSWIRSP